MTGRLSAPDDPARFDGGSTHLAIAKALDRDMALTVTTNASLIVGALVVEHDAPADRLELFRGKVVQIVTARAAR